MLGRGASLVSARVRASRKATRKPVHRAPPAVAPLAGGELALIAETFKTLSDPTRLRILVSLGGGEACVHHLCEHLAMSQPAVSHQLRLLRSARLVRARRAGREIYYALDDDHVMLLIAQARSHAGHGDDGHGEDGHGEDDR